MSVAGREVYDWLPVFDLTTADVSRVIHEAGQTGAGRSSGAASPGGAMRSRNGGCRGWERSR